MTTQAMKQNTKKTIDKKEILDKYRSLIALVILVAVVSVLSPSFLTTKNIFNVLRQTSVNAIIAGGMTFVILTGGIDLSVGSILAISGAVCASMLVSGTNIVIAVLVALVIGGVVGFLNGFVIAKGKLQPFIATLATMTVLRGLTLVFTDGKPITLGSGDLAVAFGKIGGGNILGIPTPAIIMIAVFLVCGYVLNKTTIGRHTYALGSNEDAAKLSGLNTDKIKIAVYTISGILAAVVLGGTSLTGGKGKISKTIIGALIMGVLSNALNLLDVSSYYQMMVKGVVILIAVLLDRKNK